MNASHPRPQVNDSKMVANIHPRELPSASYPILLFVRLQRQGRLLLTRRSTYSIRLTSVTLAGGSDGDILTSTSGGGRRQDTIAAPPPIKQKPGGFGYSHRAALPTDKAIDHKSSLTTVVLLATIHMQGNKTTTKKQKYKHRYHGYKFSTTTTAILLQYGTKTNEERPNTKPRTL